MDIHVDVQGPREVGLLFETFPDALYADLKDEIGALTSELLDRVEAGTPSRSGRLRSEERARVFTDPTRITGEVDVGGEKGSQDFAKAGALEYGAHRATAVKAHAMRLDHAWDRKFSEPETVMVAAYTRTPDIQAVAFERGALAGMASEITGRLEAVVEKAVAEANS